MGRKIWVLIGGDGYVNWGMCGIYVVEEATSKIIMCWIPVNADMMVNFFEKYNPHQLTKSQTLKVISSLEFIGMLSLGR